MACLLILKKRPSYPRHDAGYEQNGAQRARTALYGKRGGDDVIFIVKELRTHRDDYTGVLSLLLERCNLFL